VLEEIGQLQRRLGDPALGQDARTEALERLSRLEAEDQTLRDMLARSERRGGSGGLPEIPALRHVQSLLEPGQAILTFQLSNGYAPPLYHYDKGGSWLVLITRQGVDAFPLPDALRVEKKVRVFLGLCRRGGETERGPGAALYRELLAPALEQAGASVTRLLIVPDGCLHGLPFAALRPDADADPLGTTYEITVVPSVTMWLRWKTGGGDEPHDGSAAMAALSLADPEIRAGGDASAFREADPWLEGLRLDRLPRARAEARGLVRRIGGASLMRAGSEASERFIKEAELDRYGILHVAAHAVVDYTRPERSAIILAPGSEEEDGFLQAREIAELDLDGKVVILSSCRSASGEVIRGEGVLGLARALFVAGSRAVIGNLWPMRDEDAETFMNEFSRRIGSGASLASALTGARRARIASGAPPAAWAGIVLIGDGDLVPVPGGRFTGRDLLVWILPALGALLILGIGILVYRQRRA
jgi:CHAT domain-containing protein